MGEKISCAALVGNAVGGHRAALDLSVHLNISYLFFLPNAFEVKSSGTVLMETVEF